MFLLYVVIILDFYFKLRYVKFCFAKLYDANICKVLTKKVKETLVWLYEHYLTNHNEFGVKFSSPNQSLQELNLDDIEEDEQKSLASQFRKHLQEEDRLTSKPEVERYLLGDCEDPNDSNFDILS